MLALAVHRAGLCPHCGRPLAECTAPEAEGAYRPELPLRCHATTALLIQKDAYKDTPQQEALLYRTSRR